MFTFRRFFIPLFLLLLFSSVQLRAQKGSCPDHYYSIVRNKAIDALKEAHALGLSNPYRFLAYAFDWEEQFFVGCGDDYSQYFERFDDIYWWCDEDFGKYLKYTDEQYRSECITKWKKAQEVLHRGFDNVTNELMAIYCECIEKHRHPTAFFERGKIFYDRGEVSEFLADISALIETGRASEYITENSVYHLGMGKAYSEAKLYKKAIEALTQAIEKDPTNKEAYFERAFAYFETDNLDLALADYITSGVHPILIDPVKTHFQYAKFAQGIALGCFKGGTDSAIDFVPSLFATVHGIGKGLWSLASDPIGVSRELVDSCRAWGEFIKDNINRELLAELVPELKECIKKWDQLKEDKKGYYIGYVIGRYGVDILAFGGSTKAIALFRQLKRANTVMTLETAISSKLRQEIVEQSQQFWRVREEYKKKCKLHLGQQEKHILGANNFEKGKSELTISVNRLKELASPRLGEGIPSRYSFGEAGYREIFDFGEEIGIHVSEKSGIRTMTSVGEIHYNKKGGYHVVPIHPSRLKG